jgi:hypothetical protein
MVKMIRLTTQDPNGFYNNEFHSDIIIEPNSKIALHSLTAEIDTEAITISEGVNDNIQFKMELQQTTFRSLHITPGTYNSSNYTTLFNDITLKMNRLMFYSSNEIGRQWRVGVNTNKKVVFENTLGENMIPSNIEKDSIVKVNAVSTSSFLSNRIGGTVGNYDSFIYMKSPQCKGSSSFRAQLYNEVSYDVIIGYLASPPNTNTTNINLTDIKYGIKVNTDDTFSYIYNGVVTQYIGVPPFVAAVNDFISIDTHQNKLFLNVYNLNGTITALSQYDYNHTDDLFPVVIFLGDSSSRLKDIQFSSDPYYRATYNIVEPPEILTSIPTIGAYPTIKTLKIMDAELASFFGFKQTTYSNSPRNTTWILTSEDYFQPADFSDSFIVELLNLNVDSYDGLTKERRNFLHCIVQADIIRNRLTYTAPYLLWLDIKNTNKLSIRNLKARLLKEDLSQVNLMGISQITVIIE